MLFFGRFSSAEILTGDVQMSIISMAAGRNHPPSTRIQAVLSGLDHDDKAANYRAEGIQFSAGLAGANSVYKHTLTSS